MAFVNYYRTLKPWQPSVVLLHTHIKLNMPHYYGAR